MPSYRHQQLSVLTMNTVGFTACFAVWVMFSVIGIPIKPGLNFSDSLVSNNSAYKDYVLCFFLFSQAPTSGCYYILIEAISSGWSCACLQFH